jgi:hypothetical protein
MTMWPPSHLSVISSSNVYFLTPELGAGMGAGTGAGAGAGAGTGAGAGAGAGTAGFAGYSSLEGG